MLWLCDLGQSPVGLSKKSLVLCTHSCSTASINKLFSITWLTMVVLGSGQDPPEMGADLKLKTEAGTWMDSAMGACLTH